MNRDATLKGLYQLIRSYHEFEEKAAQQALKNLGWIPPETVDRLKEILSYIYASHDPAYHRLMAKKGLEALGEKIETKDVLED